MKIGNRRKEELYRGRGTPERERRKFEHKYGSGPGYVGEGRNRHFVQNKGAAIYQATVGKVYAEKHGHPYEGGPRCRECGAPMRETSFHYYCPNCQRRVSKVR